MAIQERLLDVDAIWDMAQQPEYDNKRFYLIDGELFEMSPVNRRHGRLAMRIGMYLTLFVEEHGLGEVNAEVGYYPAEDRHTLLAPDVAFVSHVRVNQLPGGQIHSANARLGGRNRITHRVAPASSSQSPHLSR